MVVRSRHISSSLPVTTRGARGDGETILITYIFLLTTKQWRLFSWTRPDRFDYDGCLVTVSDTMSNACFQDLMVLNTIE